MHYFADETTKPSEIIPYNPLEDVITTKMAGFHEIQNKAPDYAKYFKTPRNTIFTKEMIAFLCIQCGVEIITDRRVFEHFKKKYDSAHPSCLICQPCRSKIITNLGFQEENNEAYKKLIDVCINLKSILGIPDENYAPLSNVVVLTPEDLEEANKRAKFNKDLKEYQESPEIRPQDVNPNLLKEIGAKWIEANIEDGTQVEVNEFLFKTNPEALSKIVNQNGDISSYKITICEFCTKPVIQTDGAKEKKYCSATCRLKHYRKQNKENENKPNG